MAISKRGNGYQVSVTYQGKRVRRGAKTVEEAQRLEAEIKLDLRGAINPTTGAGTEERKPGFTMRDLFFKTRAEVWQSPESKPAKTAELVLEQFGLWEKTPAEIDADVLSEVWAGLRRKENSEATINRKRAALGRMFSYAVEMGFLQQRPPGLKQTREKAGRVRFMTKDEEKVFFELADKLGLDNLVPYVKVLLDTGGRANEVLAIKPEDIIEKRVYLDTSKGGNPRLVPLTKRAREALLTWDPRYTYDKAANEWDRVRELMGKLDDKSFTLHLCRHTCASRLVMGGMDLRRVKDWLGHKAIGTTLRYAHLMPNALDGGADILEASDKKKKKKKAKKKAKDTQ